MEEANYHMRFYIFFPAFNLVNNMGENTYCTVLYVGVYFCANNIRVCFVGKAYHVLSHNIQYSIFRAVNCLLRIRVPNMGTYKVLHI